MNKDINEFKDLIKLMQETPKAPVPGHFTQNVMGRLAVETREGIYTRAWSFLTRTRESTLNPIRALHVGSGNIELVGNFFIAGFVYAIIGISLLIGFAAFKSVTMLPEWISLQPFLWLASALMFLLCGVVLYAGVNHGFNLVRSYVFFHIGFAIINGIFISLSSALPLTIMFAALFAMPVIIIASSFFMSKDKTRKFLTQGENFSHAVQ